MGTTLARRLFVALGVCLLVQAVLLGPIAHFADAGCGLPCEDKCSAATGQTPPGCIGGLCVVSVGCGSCGCETSTPPPPNPPKCDCITVP